MTRRLLPFIALCGCELAGPGAEALVFEPPPTPELESIRSTTTVTDPAPRAAPILIPPDPPKRLADVSGVRSSSKRWFISLSPEARHQVRRVCRMQVANPCWMIRVPDKTNPDSIHGILASFEADAEQVDDFCRKTTRSRGCNTPLVVSFDGDVEFTRATDARFTFGTTPVATDWPSADTPWIALDRDGDGAITSGAELFGDATVLARRTTATNGFAALESLDANRDGVIDRDDPAFAKLLLWADADADRKSSPDELRLLAGVVVAIPLAHRLDARCANGNCEGERGTARLHGARTAAVIDIYLSER